MVGKEDAKYMIPRTIEELDRIRDECKSMVNKRATSSAAIAIVPVPGADLVADVAIMLELLPAINRKFGLSQEQIEKLDSAIKAKILVIITSIGSQLIGKVITKELVVLLLKKVGVRVAIKQVAKFIPFVGQAVSAGISFAAMKYLGNSHIEECYSVCKRVID
ncbi:hypothetical protein [Paenibacillus periandrae]|uniref:hypothetical protein n=1 Tax=Paenibacillus periandrae TaxID=1761741 RepID=UPI001F095ED1